MSTGATYSRGRMLRGGTLVFAGSVVQKATNLVVLGLLARELGVRSFAVYAFAFAFGVFFETLSDFGIDYVTTRELNQRPAEEHGRIVGSAIVGKAAAISVTVVAAVAVAFLYDGDLRPAAMIASVGILAGIPGTFGIALKARMDMIQPVVMMTATTVIGGAVIVAAAYQGTGPVGLVAIQVGFRVLSSIVVVPMMRRRLAYRLSFDSGDARRLVRAALPLAVSTIAVVVFARIDQLLLGALSRLPEVGRYGASVRLVDSFSVLPIAIGTVFLPALSQLSVQAGGRFRRLAERGVRYLAVVLLPTAALATAVGGPLLEAVFGAEFRGSGSVFALLLWAHFFASVWVLARPALVARNRMGYLAVLAIAAAALNVGLNLWLIPRYGAEGAAWSSLVSYAFPFVLGLFMIEIRDAFVAPLRAAARPLAAAAGTLAVLTLAPGGTVATVALFAVTAPLLLVVTGSATPTEARELLSSFRNRAEA